MISKGLVVGIILLFIGVAIQPGIIADVSKESDNSELVEITVEIYEVDKTYNHTVMLTQEQAEELELLINNTKNELDASDNSDETKNIFMNTVISLNELGLLPNSMSVIEAQRLVTGEEQNPRIVKLFERYNSKNQKSLFNNDNILCLIAGETINTVFIGPFALLCGLRVALLLLRQSEFLKWLKNNNPELWSWLSENFGEFGFELLRSRMGLWIAFGAGLNFLPLKIGAYIHYGFFKFSFDPFDDGTEDVPAEGWVNAYGLYGKKEWSDDFYGDVLGFTGIKIIRGLLDFFYLGAALRVRIEDA